MNGYLKGRAVRVVGVGLVCASVAIAPPASAQDRGIQLSRNETRVLVNKDVGSERWAISLNNPTQTLTGNVFASDGGAPSFLFCEPEGGVDSYRCQGSGPCTSDDCLSQYVDLGLVSLPADFFLPPGVDLTNLATATATAAAGDGTARAAADNVGFQETPDGQHVLVSSDVGNERWAIALNRDDRTLTGNVFFPDGGEPAFISCQQALSLPDVFDCYGAGPCIEDGCEDQYSFISQVTLPDEFFGPSTCGNAKVEGNERCEAGSFCAVLCGTDELCLQLGASAIPRPGICSDDCSRCVSLDF